MEMNLLRKAARNLHRKWALEVNKVLKEIKTNNITRTNRLIKSGIVYTGNKAGLKPKLKCSGEEKGPR